MSDFGDELLHHLLLCIDVDLGGYAQPTAWDHEETKASTTPSHSTWDQTPGRDVSATPARKRNRWDATPTVADIAETPSSSTWGETPKVCYGSHTLFVVFCWRALIAL